MLCNHVQKNLTFLLLSKKFVFFSRIKFSNLTQVFNMKAYQQPSSYQREKTGLFQVPELSAPEGFYYLQKKCIKEIEQLTKDALSSFRMRKMVEIFDDMSNSLCKVADLAEFIRLAHPSSEYRNAAEETCLVVNQIVEKLNTNRRLYDKLKHNVTEGDVVPTIPIDTLVGQLFLFDFEQNGIHLSDNMRQKVVTLNYEILNIGQKFVGGCDRAMVVDKSLIPANLHFSFPCQGNNIIISGWNADSPNPICREVSYRIFYRHDKHQELVLNKMLNNRHDLATTCGFKSFSERVLRGGIIDNPNETMQFLETTSSNIESLAELEFKILSQIKRKEKFSNNELAVWDVPYYIGKAKQDWCQVTHNEYCPYFSLGTCMEGLNIIFCKLYGISLINVPLMDGECWAKGVYKLAVQHETEGILGYIYCDLFDRSEKQVQDCHFTIQGGKQLSGDNYQIPVAVLMMNLKPPQWGEPSLLTPHNVDNLFHEMGHAMHSMLARTKYQHVTGTRCSTDFAEVPSVLMEYFASDSRILSLFAKHYETGDPMPENMMSKLCATKKIFSTCETRMQLFYSILDQRFHSENPICDMEEIAEMQEKYYGLKHVQNTSWHLRFSHLVGYGAKYYSYLVSRSVAHSIWKKYFKNDPLNRESGEKYRRECLAHGGGKNPSKLVADYLINDVTPTILAEALVSEITSNHETLMQFQKSNVDYR